MLLNYLFFALIASCMAGNVTAETSAPQNLPDNLGNVNIATSNGSNPGSAAATQKSVAETNNQPPGINLTTTDVPSNIKDVNKNISLSNNDTATYVTDDKNIVIDKNKTAGNNIVKDSNKVTNITVSDTSTVKNTNKTETQNTVDNITNTKANNASDDNIVDHKNITNSSKIVNITTVSQSNSTIQKPDRSHTSSKKSDTENEKIKPDGPSQTTSIKSNTIDQNNKLPPTPLIQANGTDINIYSNGSSIIQNNNSTKNENITAARSTNISSGVQKWEVILITALVVAVGCCSVVLVKKSLRSERGRAWLERTRHAHVPGRDYEVEYLVIRDSDD